MFINDSVSNLSGFYSASKFQLDLELNEHVSRFCPVQTKRATDMMKAKQDSSTFKELALILLWFGISLEKEKFGEFALLVVILSSLEHLLLIVPKHQ